RAGFATPSGDAKAEPLSVGVSGTFRQFMTPNNQGSTPDSVRYSGGAFALDALIPVISASDEKDVSNTLVLSGEFTSGLGYGDEFPSWTGNLAQWSTGTAPTSTPNLDAGQGGFDSSGSFQLVKLQSWNTQVQYHLP